MASAEKAVAGGRRRPYLELNAFEVGEVLFGADQAVKMFFHGVKRSREVGNLVVGLLRPGLRCADAVVGLADVELGLRHEAVGPVVHGERPDFADHLVMEDPKLGAPHAVLVPGPPR